MDKIAYYVLTAFAVIITLTVHEYCHAYSAYRLGDPTARSLGRLTLNPLRHIDIFGAICMLIFGFGWAKPVPVNARYLEKPRRDMAIIALAGPLSNLVMAIIAAFAYRLIYALLRGVNFPNDFLLAAAQSTVDFFYIFHSVNVGIAIFNLLPIPPLDGSRILGIILPPRVYYNIMRYERIIYYVLLGWLFLGDPISDYLLSLPVIAANPLLYIGATLISLSNILSYAISAVSTLIFMLTDLIPFLRI